MKNFIYSFNGRQNGAIGIFYAIRQEYKANSLEEANSMLYYDYEHITGLKINGIPLSHKDIEFKDTGYKGEQANYKPQNIKP